MRDTNTTILTGRICSDIEHETVGDNLTLAEFRLAVNCGYKGNEDKTGFFSVKCFSHSANFVNKYAAKGDKLLVEGRLEHEQWETDGKKQSKVVVIGDKIQLLESKKKRADADDATHDFQHTSKPTAQTDDANQPF